MSQQSKVKEARDDAPTPPTARGEGLDGNPVLVAHASTLGHPTRNTLPPRRRVRPCALDLRPLRPRRHRPWRRNGAYRGASLAGRAAAAASTPRARAHTPRLAAALDAASRASTRRGRALRPAAFLGSDPRGQASARWVTRMKHRAPPTSPHTSHRSSEPSRRAALGLRLRVRLHRWQLDRELAEGCFCDASRQRELRAGQLSDPLTSRKLAASLRQLVAGTQRPRASSLGSAVPVVREAVLGWQEGLLGLAEQLERARALNPRGVARVQVLLTDGSGPLYNPSSERSLTEAIWWIADGLQSCPPHDWGCPVIMKLDPDHVGWTCAHCGAIATTDDPAVKPA
jgi:hypothetical protein